MTRIVCDHRRITALVAVLGLAVTACSPRSEPSDPAAQHGLARTPVASGEQLSAADVSDVQLPTQFDRLVTVAPPWDLPVQSGTDISLSAEETERALVFRAVDTAGTVAWTAERPLSCSGFVVTEDADGRELAVLTDTQEGEDRATVLTASAFDLATGEAVWGPVEVPGPHSGPGLVFQAPPEGFMGESGQPIALDPTTGEQLGPHDGRILGEFDGVVLRTDSDALTGTRGTGDPDWRIPLDGLGAGASADDLTAAPQQESAPGLVLLNAGDGSGPLIDLESGAILSERARDAARDLGSGTTALLDAEGLILLDGAGDEQLAMSVSEQTELEAVVGVLVYLRDGSAVRVHNGVTGGIAQAYAQDGRGPVAVPVHVTAEGTGTLAVGGTTLLATSRIADDRD